MNITFSDETSPRGLAAARLALDYLDQNSASDVGSITSTVTTPILPEGSVIANVSPELDTPRPDKSAPTTQDEGEEPTLDLASLDKSGVPWDARIHSSNKKQTGKGIWNKRKGISADEFNRIHAELLAVHSQTDASTVGFGQVQGNTSAPPATSNVEWSTVVQKCMAARSEGSISQEQMDAEAVKLGAANFIGLKDSPDQHEMFLMILGL